MRHLLFNIFFSESWSKIYHSNCLLCADDLKMFREIKLLKIVIQIYRGGKVNTLEGHSNGHSKQVHMYMCPIPNGFRDRAISLYRRATRHVLTRVAKCIDVYGGIL
jgi:hypothetical protein